MLGKTKKFAWMAEWSKAADLSSVLYGGVGSNPTSSKLIKFLKIKKKEAE